MRKRAPRSGYRETALSPTFPIAFRYDVWDVLWKMELRHLRYFLAAAEESSFTNGLIHRGRTAIVAQRISHFWDGGDGTLALRSKKQPSREGTGAPGVRHALRSGSRNHTAIQVGIIP
jgi:hypothetical protein